MTEKQNAKQHAERIFFRHMVSGVVGYENEKIMVDNAAIERMNASFSGKPIYVNHQDVDLSNIETQAAGYVVRSFYNAKDGWFWGEALITSDAGHEAVKKGWKVSNAYMPTEWAKGGQYLNVDYNRKVVNGEFTHLAIVPNPRYEEAEILKPDEFKKYQENRDRIYDQLHNSKPKKENTMKFWKNDKKEITNSEEFNADMLCPVGDTHVAYSVLVAAYEELQNTKKEEKENKDDVPMKKEEEGTDDKKKKKTKENEADEEEETENKKEEKTNAKTFTEEELAALVSKAVAQAITLTNEKNQILMKSKTPITL